MSVQDDIERGYAKQKARFYADPRFAGLVGLAVGLAAGWFFF